VVRKLIIILAFIALVFIPAAGCSSSEETGIEWYHDGNEALTKAQDESKVIMINFYTDVCPACKKLDSETFTDEALADFLNENFISLKINAGRNSLAGTYGITAVPTTIFTAPSTYSQNNEIARAVGFITVDELSEGLLEILDYWNSLSANPDSDIPS